MAITTYSELQTAVSNWLARSDLTSRIPEFIALAEARMNRLMRSRSMITSATLNPSTSVKNLALPTGWMETISFVNDLGEELEAVTFDDLEELAYGTNSSRPMYYAIDDEINFDCVAGSTYNYKMRYYKRLDIASDLTNTILTNAPDAYLYGALMSAEPYLKNDQRVMLWAEAFNKAIAELNHQEAKSRRALRTEFTGNSFNIIRGY